MFVPYLSLMRLESRERVDLNRVEEQEVCMCTAYVSVCSERGQAQISCM